MAVDISATGGAARIAKALRVRRVGLAGVDSPIHEEAEAIRHHTGGRLKTELPHFPFNEVSWIPDLSPECGNDEW